MTLLLVLLSGFGLLSACAPEATTCDQICNELVMTCEYDAYPTRDSCEEGCAYEQSVGADMDGELSCIQRASCDTFEVVACERHFGAVEQ